MIYRVTCPHYPHGYCDGNTLLCWWPWGGVRTTAEVA
jgi:hypothetical protein